MRALVIGGDGTVGRALVEALARRGDAVFSTTRRADRAKGDDRLLLDLSAPQAVPLPAVDVAFLCAAVTGYAVCRNQPELAHRINVDNSAILARQLLERGTRLIYLSTSAVFDGRLPQRRATDSTAPVSEYGRSKAAAEAALMTLAPNVAIVRLTKVLPPEFPLFTKWCDALSRDTEIRAFADMQLAPIGLDHVTTALTAIADTSEAGIFQVSASRDISYFEAAQHLARRLAAPAELVRRDLAADQGVPGEERPAFTSMDASRLTALIGQPAPGPFTGIDGSMAARFNMPPLQQVSA